MAWDCRCCFTCLPWRRKENPFTACRWKGTVCSIFQRSGLVVSDQRVLDAMEVRRERGYRFLPLRVKADGSVTGEALASAEQMGRLGKHVQRVLEDICRELAGGNIAADPFWRGPEKNACRFCDYAAACHFEPGRGGDCKRWLSGVDAQEFWEQIEGEA